MLNKFSNTGEKQTKKHDTEWQNNFRLEGTSGDQSPTSYSKLIQSRSSIRLLKALSSWGLSPRMERLPPLLSASSIACPASGGMFFFLLHIVRILLAIACVHCLSLAVHLRRVCLCVFPNHTHLAVEDHDQIPLLQAHQTQVSQAFLAHHMLQASNHQWLSAGLTSVSECFSCTGKPRNGLPSAVKSRITTSLNLLATLLLMQSSTQAASISTMMHYWLFQLIVYQDPQIFFCEAAF